MKRLHFLLLLSLAGCGGSGTDLSNPEHVSTWANSASALGVYTLAYEPIALADGEFRYDDPLCPVTSDSGTRVEIIGNCTNFRERRYEGTATVIRRGDGARLLTLSQFGSAAGGADVAVATGSVGVYVAGADEQIFEADVTQEGGVTWSVHYAGRVRGTYVGPTVWNGHGTVSRDGLLGPTGTASAETVDMVRDSALCDNQGASGATTIEIEGQTLRIEYDGATDCDADHAARHFVNGEDRGLVTGVTCSAGPGGRTALPFWAALVALGLLVRRRRAPSVRYAPTR